MTSPRIEWQNNEILEVLSDGSVKTTPEVAAATGLGLRACRRALVRLRARGLVASRKRAEKKPIETGHFSKVPNSFRWVQIYEWRATTESERLMANVTEAAADSIRLANELDDFFRRVEDAYGTDCRPERGLVARVRTAIESWFDVKGVKDE